ncbi:hypothetical protein [Botrimarina sp.]|uniref:hypothetical protein n=1 Tax=Botrimarina sp. TaxID=2795802 RepID=UPI0032EF91DE
MRFVVAVGLFLCTGVAAVSDAAPAGDVISGLWTHLLIDGAPEEPRRLPVIYQGHTMASAEKLRVAAANAAREGTPIVLDIEHHPTDGSEIWWLDRHRDSTEVFNRAENYFIDRLAVAQSVGATASLWSRPSQNQMLHIWKSGHRELREKYANRWDDAARVLPLQDFVAIQLYMPRDHRPYTEKGFPLSEWKARGDWFVNHARRHGKPAMLFLSPTWGGSKTPYIPPDWLIEVTSHFLQDGGSVCVWGGQGKTWDPSHPMCQALGRIVEESRRYAQP